MVEHGVIGVNVIVLHMKIKEFLISLLFFGSVSKGSAESIFKLSPKDLVILLEISGGQEFGFEFIFLFLGPVIDLGASDE
jgi:hypothetical protein